MSRATFRIPCSTSNLGAGFDALGLALDRHLTVSVEAAPEFVIEAEGESTSSIPLGPDNLILHVAHRVAAQRAWTLPPFRLRISNGIPVARGLGSSAAAIIAGITCYELVTRDRLTDDEIFQYAYEFESHPDNLAPSLYGGLISAATSSTRTVHFVKLNVAAGATPVVIIPEFDLSTAKARAVLPSSYSRADAVYNIQRAALTVAALTSGKWETLREAMRDRLHEPYRAPLIPGLEQILQLETPGLLGIALSGAGPTVLAFARPDCADAVGAAVENVFKTHSVRSSAFTLNIDTKGRVIERHEEA
jgi:homoserine kinase